MIERIRNTILALGVVSFLATAFGITLYLHLAQMEEPARHDTAHCPLCQQLLIAKKPFTAEIESADIEIDVVGRLFQMHVPPLLGQDCQCQRHPRAPPA